jgi:hypothetical protein
MKPQRFEAILLEGHKEAGLEVPFDPARQWSLPIKHLKTGRWGHEVEGTLNDIPLQGVIVPRSGRFYLVVDAALQESARVSPGKRVLVVLKPRSAVETSRSGPALPRKRRASGRTRRKAGA